ncbi:MAG TPA: PspA/IM30 family protein [Planctomycetaceae bacterium]|jgi:phage shock protein A|nr:PspA/IM30 family protein [Planctomycetaceae bacterium]
MNYFSRLTDIVTCNLSEMLAREADPPAALKKIIAEMEEGLAGARRGVGTAAANEERLRREIAELAGQTDQLTDEAREALRNHDESGARVALIRKQEVVDVVAGLEQQHKAACATRDHLNTTLRALEARLSEARRRQQELQTSPKATVTTSLGSNVDLEDDDPRARAIDDELAALKRELSGL